MPEKDDQLSGPTIQPTLMYPENITLANLNYFIAVPTLCYQMEYPRSERIRGRWLARRVVELMLFGGLMLFLVDQYVEPAILNSLVPMQQSNIPQVAERLLKLSLPCLYVWLCMFYLVRYHTS
jgi:diacylglycerol O-acyltransferase 1